MSIRILFFSTILILLLFIITTSFARVRHNFAERKGPKHFKNYGIGSHVKRNASSNLGMWPSVFNLATKAIITVNATCGDGERQEFCRIVEGGNGRCGVCDNFSSDLSKHHPIKYAIDGTNRWWQSPALYYGSQYEYITITIDLKQVYQITYIIIKAANSPRPSTWILERSIDGYIYIPWQYFARSDKECLERFGIPATKGKPHYFTDSEVICTSFYSRLTPLENGEIHTSLVHGRPGANETSPELLEFTKARYVRLRLMGLRANIGQLPRWFPQDITKDKYLYYTIRDISIGGQCLCNGHAESCRHNVASGHPECECAHHTCGANCDKCCPMFNQRHWGPGTSRDAHQCLPCNCHEHATSCYYDENVDRSGLSMDIHGNYQGGGVCENCTDYTDGINCEKCIPGFYRPFDIQPNAKNPCRKCDCHPLGSNGTCIMEGKDAGVCICLPGYSGDKCESCSLGYRGYPTCETCPCDSKGSLPMDNCEGECFCKENVDGKYCDRCKEGYFGFGSDDIKGCLSCYCSDVTTLCESALLKYKLIQTLNEWLITDFNVNQLVKPSWDDKGLFSVGNYELAEYESLYWLAPKLYLGNKLEAYGSYFIFKVHWVIMRGDTSGKPTIGPNIILIGNNGLKIAFGNDFFTNSNMTFNIQLIENGWYHIPSELSDIETRSKQTNVLVEKVTRNEFLSVLINIKYIMLRATFHTDQIESLLEEATLEISQNDNLEYYSMVEKCSCPSGYSGLSCEICAFGYVQIISNESSINLSSCEKCDCNGHSETCNADKKDCNCQHNTIGDTCERCAAGYYGNPLRGTTIDCKKCACPLENDENNFSPSCQLDYISDIDNDNDKYVCTQCPKGYTGDHCEICDDGYYGNPLEIGNQCKICNCNGGPCDRLTGQCLNCKGNTEGWKCDRCKAGYYGDATIANCKPCQCDPLGAQTNNCDNTTGQCLCKPRFTERTCDKCETGYGNVSALCIPCNCNEIGSKSLICDSHSGLCNCQEGVEGFFCDTCQNLHYGYSENGCKPCGCHPEGSQFATCDVKTGKCICKPHNIGRKCDMCENGYWRNHVGDCVPCMCDINGSISENCDQNSGFCNCKFGVGGPTCNSCLPNYYGTPSTGCKECETCNKEGHICHPENGKCVCPPLTIGSKCERCTTNAWGYEPGIGCKLCECSTYGSVKFQCDKFSGKCSCKNGYEGEKCNRCALGYYGYSNCQKCNCNRAGTLTNECTHDTCQCSIEGYCSCKTNVEGKHCNRCKKGTFGIDPENPLGCTDCFCFGRTNQCTASMYTWDQIRTNKVDNVETCLSNITCSELPLKFIGDLTLSYGGYLRFSFKSPPFLPFLIFITGNGVVLEYKGNETDIKLIESNWQYGAENKIRLPNQCRYNLNRKCFMVVLQNITNIKISSFEKLHFQEILLDKATNLPGNLMATSIEKCDCPKEYTSLSCQNPNTGYYRNKKIKGDNNFIDRIIGKAKKCECNGRSTICDTNTGYCLNCTNNTSGPGCELCDEGFYKDLDGNCLPCLCPSERQNFAKSCTITKKYNQFVCKCKEGYSGKKCNKCEDSYYGNLEDGGNCQPCNCNIYGSIDQICNKLTGYCQCHIGFTGQQCSQCVRPMEVIENGICTPCDECTQILFRTINDIENDLNNSLHLFNNNLVSPWPVLEKNNKSYQYMKENFYKKLNKSNDIVNKYDIIELEDKFNKIKSHIGKKNHSVTNFIKSIHNLNKNLTDLNTEIDICKNNIKNIINNLNNFGNSYINTKDALRQGKNILINIKEIVFNIKSQEKNMKVRNFCDKIYNEVNSIYNDLKINPKQIKLNVDDLRQRLKDLNRLLDETESLINLINEKNQQNLDLINKLKYLFESVNNKYNEISFQLSDTLLKINSTKKILIEAEIDKEKLSKDTFIKLIENLPVHNENINIPLYDYVAAVKNHVRMLNNQINLYKNLFNFTTDEWKKINASAAYENLIKGVNKAFDDAIMAQTTLESALNIIYPQDDDSLPDKTNLALAFSDRLKQRIFNLKNRQNDFNDIKDECEKLKYSILKNGKDNNDLNIISRNMLNQVIKQHNGINELENVKQIANNISDRMVTIEQEIKNLNIDMQYNFKKNYQKYYNLAGGDEIKKLIDQVILTRLEVKKVDTNFSSINEDIIKKTSQGKFDTYQNKLKSIENQMKILKNKINYAKQAASSINVAMSISNCRRFYKIQNDVFKSLTITFKCHTCYLFNLTNTLGQTISLYVKNNQILFKWKNEERIIENSFKTTTIHLQKIGAWIQIKSNRMTEEINPIIDKELFKITDYSFIQIGNLSKKHSNNEACIYRCVINDYNIGLWNFIKTEGTCMGCQKDTNITTGHVLFTGQGYRNVTGARTTNPKSYNFLFYFTTFDENNLIFLAQDKENPCSYITLGLNKGYLQLNVRHVDGTNISLTTNKTYNSGRETRAEIGLYYKDNIQIYSLVSEDGKFTKQQPLKINNVFKIKKSFIFIGGLPNNLDVSCIPLELKAFLGYLRPGNAEYSDPIRTTSYGTKIQTGTLQFTNAWFLNKGIIHIETNKKFKIPLDVSLIIRPETSNSFLMEIKNLINLFIKNNKILLQWHTNEHIISSNLNRDINFINLFFSNNSVKILINDYEEEIRPFYTNLQENFLEILLGNNLDGQHPNFLGGISNLVINNSTIMLNASTIKYFANVEIGKEQELKFSFNNNHNDNNNNNNTKQLLSSLTETNTIKEIQNTEGCPLIGSYATDPDAVKFGDKPNSYIYIENNFWKKDYYFEFQFRTFYPNGILLLTLGGKNYHYNVLEIREGKLQIKMKGRKLKIITIPNKINDGKWHHIFIKQSALKKKRKLLINLDNSIKKTLRIARNNVNGELYIGGFPFNFTDNIELKDRLHPFRGCIRTLKINGILQVLVKNKKNIFYNNIGQCFPNIEQGAYFGGDAYVIYKSDFQVSKVLELSLQFRTVEQNGILLSISNPGNSPALSVELQSGAIAMTIDMGNGAISNVTNSLNSDFTLCDNQWHNITALYSSSELTVNVDGIRKSWVQSDVNSLMDEIKAPLFIGGLSNNASSGTLKIKENFKGCIRNFKIEEKLMDWSDMEELKNVLLNSCPVIVT